MNKSRKARKGGPLLWQLKLRLKRMKRRLDADLSAMEVKLVAAEASSEDVRNSAPTREALQAARQALASHDNCLITAHPDQPRSEVTGWTTDFQRELQLLDVAIGLTTANPLSLGPVAQALGERSGSATGLQAGISPPDPVARL